MASKEYSLLPDSESGTDERRARFQRPNDYKSWFRIVLLLSSALIASLALNLFCVYELTSASPRQEPVSKYVGLAYDVPTELMRDSAYNSVDRAVQDAAWEDTRLKPENGAVALEESWAEAKDLPHSMRSPWDANKGIYAFLSSHEVHCLHVMREIVNNVHDGEAVNIPYGHMMHCLDILRQTVMCNADDTLMYTGRLHSQAEAAVPQAGIGSVKMCRDWDKLQEWGRAHSACYRPLNFSDPTIKELDRYKFCPDGSRPWEDLKE